MELLLGENQAGYRADKLHGDELLFVSHIKRDGFIPDWLGTVFLLSAAFFSVVFHVDVRLLKRAEVFGAHNANFED